MRLSRKLLTTCLLAAIAAGCQSETAATCVPGQAIACACAGGLVGAQACRPDQTYGPCSCLDRDSGVAPADVSGSGDVALEADVFRYADASASDGRAGLARCHQRAFVT